jgi:hypothetical protein
MSILPVSSGMLSGRDRSRSDIERTDGRNIMSKKKLRTIYTKEHVIESYREGLVDGMSKGERVSSDILNLYDRINTIRKVLKDYGYVLPNNKLSSKGESMPMIVAIFDAIDLKEE